MATHKGSEGVVKFNTSNTVAEVRSYSIESTADTLEDTTMGDSARTFLPSLTSWSGSLDCLWDETDSTGQMAADVGTSITITVFPEGAATGAMRYSGSAIITGKSVTGSYDGLVEATITFQGTGALTEATA